MNKLAISALSTIVRRVDGITALERALLAAIVPIALVVSIRAIAAQEAER